MTKKQKKQSLNFSPMKEPGPAEISYGARPLTNLSCSCQTCVLTGGTMKVHERRPGLCKLNWMGKNSLYRTGCE